MFAIFARRAMNFAKDQTWSKVLLFCFTLFLARIADAIISFWAPVQIQSALNDPFVMGLIISSQSVIGFVADLLFPRMLRTVRARRLVMAGIIMSALTSLFLVGSVLKPFILIFLVTMVLWGIYYELVSFASYQFMGSTVPSHLRSSGWAIAGVFINLAYFLGPLLAALLLAKSFVLTEAIILIFLLLAFIFFVFTNHLHDVPSKVDLTEINPWVELKHWFTLAEHIWPAIIISLVLGFIDSTFWTTGAVLTEKLSTQSAWGGLFLPLYQLPAVIMGFIVAGWGIYKGKKILSEKVLIVAGLFLAGLGLSGAIAWQLTMVLAASVALSIVYPLIEGVYTDILARMGKEKKEMIGLTSSVVNLAYVIWPPIAGLIAGRFGERGAFSIVGIGAALIAFILLFITPKKLRLPQEEIKTWE